MASLGWVGAAAALGLGCAVANGAAATEAPPVRPPYGPSLTLDQAKAVLAAAQSEARRRGIVISVAVVDAGGYLVCAERMDGASLASSETVLLKAKSAVVWQRSTSTWIAAIEASHGSQTTYPHVYAGGGGEPILSGGRIVGGVGIGGSTPAIETEIANLAIAAIK